MITIEHHLRSKFFLFVEKPAPKKYETTVSVQANYEPSYSDLDSSESRAFIKNFTNKVEPFLRARLSGFRGIEVTRLSDGSVVVDFIILLERNSNATTNAIVSALVDGNSTGELGVVLTGNISLQEITESFTTDSPRTIAREKDNNSILIISYKRLKIYFVVYYNISPHFPEK